MDTNIQKVDSSKKIFADAWKFFKENFKKILDVVLILIVPVVLLHLILLITYGSNAASASWTKTFGVISSFLNMILIYGTVFYTAFLFKAKHENKDSEFHILKNYRPTINFANKIFTTILFVVLFIFLMSIIPTVIAIGVSVTIAGLVNSGHIWIALIFMLPFLLFIPSIVYGVYWRFSFGTALLKGVYNRKALSYSKSLVKGRWWKAVGYFAVIGLVLLLILIIGQLIITLLTMHSIIGILISGLYAALFAAFAIIVHLHMFLAFDATKKQDTVPAFSVEATTV